MIPPALNGARLLNPNMPCSHKSGTNDAGREELQIHGVFLHVRFSPVLWIAQCKILPPEFSVDRRSGQGSCLL
jgi:hypothetical protein